MGLTPPTKNKQPVHGDLVLITEDGCDASDTRRLRGEISPSSRGAAALRPEVRAGGQGRRHCRGRLQLREGRAARTLGAPTARSRRNLLGFWQGRRPGHQEAGGREDG